MIQRSLLPQIPPSLLNYSVQTLYRPGHNIGGDLYDAVCIGDRYLVLVVVDASGHGVSAAMLAVLFKLRLRVADEVTGLPLAPAVALSEMNARLVKDIKAPGVFFTCVYAVLDVETGELVLASAGHPPAICLRESGDYELLEHTGPALGLDHEATFTERRIHLAAADRVLMYTDGVFDVGGDSPPDAPSIARTLHEMTVDVRLLERLLTSVSSGLDRDDRDDVTLLLLDARSGQSSFLLSEVTQTVEADRLDETPEVAWAEDATLRYFRLSGRVTWTFGEALLASAVDAIDAGRNLAVDLSRCIYLDSTMLGTLHEIVEAAIAAQVNVLLSGVPAPVVASIGELSMTDVLAHVTDESLVAPGELHLLDIGETDLSAQRNRLIRAHEVLMSLSTENEEEFRNVVETLRADETGEEGRGASTRS